MNEQKRILILFVQCCRDFGFQLKFLYACASRFYGRGFKTLAPSTIQGYILG